MAKVSGLGDNFYIAGVDISGDVNSLSQISCPGAVQDATDITQSATARLELLNDGALDFNVFFDTGPRSQGATALPVLEKLAAGGVLLAPGDAFGRSYARWARLCYTALPRERLDAGLRRMEEILT